MTMQVSFNGTRAGARVSSSIITKEIDLNLSRGLIRIDDGSLRQALGGWMATVRLQKKIGRNVLWSRITIRSLDLSDGMDSVSVGEDDKSRFIQHIAVRDGCPADEAKKMAWDSMVESFFDGNNELARQQMAEWIKENP